MVHLISGRIGIKRADNYVPDFWAAAWCRAMRLVGDDPIGWVQENVDVREEGNQRDKARRGEVKSINMCVWVRSHKTYAWCPTTCCVICWD